MIELNFAGPIPDNVKNRALTVVSSRILRTGTGWKKGSGLKYWYSFRLNSNYRVLRSIEGSIFVSNHDLYEKKIKKLKKVEA